MKKRFEILNVRVKNNESALENWLNSKIKRNQKIVSMRHIFTMFDCDIWNIVIENIFP